MESDRNDCVAQSADVDRRRRRSSARRRMYPICILIFQSVSHLTRYINLDTSRYITSGYVCVWHFGFYHSICDLTKGKYVHILIYIQYTFRYI